MNRILLLLLIACINIAGAFELEKELSFDYWGTWDFIVQEKTNTCEALEQYQYSGKKMALSSENQLTLYDIEGVNFIGDVVEDDNKSKILYLLDEVSFQFLSSNGSLGQDYVLLQLEFYEDKNTLVGVSSAKSNNGACGIYSLIGATKKQGVILLEFLDDENQPVEKVKVTMSEIENGEPTRFSFSYESNTLGTMSFQEANVAAGSSYELKFEKTGYQFDQNNIEVSVVDSNQYIRVRANPIETEQEARAIILAGGGDLNDALWPATNASANFAYRALLYKGIRKENIRYLNFDQDQDVDNDGEKNDIATIPSMENFRSSILEWAGSHVNKNKPLIIYMLDHGLKDQFFISKNATINGQTESLDPKTLDQWLDSLQAQTNAKVILIYDACFSGSFMQELKATGDQKRILIFSAGEDELAFFGAKGDLSFSSFFWNHTIKGKSVRDSFINSRQSIRTATNQVQKPVLDDDGDGQWDSHKDGGLSAITYLGNPLVSAAALPEVTDATASTNINPGNSLTVYARVDLKPEKVRRVWVSVVAPKDGESGDQPVTDIPEYELSYNSSKAQYEAVLGNFSQTGVYQLSFYAQANDKEGFTSFPVTREVAVFGETGAATIEQINTIFDWAEGRFSQYFDSEEVTKEASGYIYRYYAGTKTYLATKDNRVYVYNPQLGLVDVGAVLDIYQLAVQ